MKYEYMPRENLIKELTEINENIRSFIHDIGSSFSAVWGYTDLATMWVNNDNGTKEELSEYLNGINTHMNEIEQLIKETSLLTNKIRFDNINSLIEQKDFDDKVSVSSIEEKINYKLDKQNISPKVNTYTIIDELRDIMENHDVTTNIHINEEDIAGTQVKINQIGLDHIKVDFPSDIGFYTLIPFNSVLYFKIRPSKDRIDIYLR